MNVSLRIYMIDSARSIRSLELINKDAFLLTALDDPKIIAWDMSSFEIAFILDNIQNARILKASPNNEFLIAGGRKSLNIFSLPKKMLKHSKKLEENHNIISICFFNDNMFAVIDLLQVVSIFDLKKFSLIQKFGGICRLSSKENN